MKRSADRRLRSARLVLVEAPVRRLSELERRVRAHHQAHGRVPARTTVRHAYLHGRDGRGHTAWAGPFPERLAEAPAVARVEADCARAGRGLPPAHPEVDLLLWALDEPEAQAAAAVPTYASALGVRQPAVLRSLKDVFAAGFTALKVDLAPAMSLDQRQVLDDLAGRGALAVDAQSRFPDVAAAVAAAPAGCVWLEDPTPAPTCAEVADAPVRIVVGESFRAADQLQRWALVPNAVVQLEIARLGATAARTVLAWLAERSLRCRLHGRMPLTSAVLATWFVPVVLAVEVHLAWVGERLCSLDVFDRAEVDALQFLATAMPPVLDMTPADAAAVVHTRALWG